MSLQDKLQCACKRFTTLPVISDIWLAAYRLIMHDGMEIAGYMAYTALLSLFPFLIFLFAFAGLFGQQILAEQLVQEMLASVPNDVADAIRAVVQDIMLNRNGGLLTIGIAASIWIASTGVEALRHGVNRAYGRMETRPFWLRRIYSFCFVIVGAFVGLVTSGMIVIGPIVIQWITTKIHLSTEWLHAEIWVRYGLSFCILTALFCIAYKLLPDHGKKKPAILPGALVGVMLWLLLASLFSFYLSHFGRYSVMYGSLAGIVITLLFMQFSAVLLLYGAELNALLDEQE